MLKIRWFYTCFWRLPSPNHLNICQSFLMSFSFFGICKKECLKEAICQVLCRSVFRSPKTIKNGFIMYCAFPEGRLALPGSSHHSHMATHLFLQNPLHFVVFRFFQCQWLFNKKWKPCVILMCLVDRAWPWLRACSCLTPEMLVSPRGKHHFLGLRVSGVASDSSASRPSDSTAP